ncbi:type II toxin-antitoxin system prevent-host-death family antitoxin [Desulfobacter postgatei]|jgi:prevent-host-death family protein|uniref:type II toxin-antitoxin system Phd/YefM family antitoxin n=1 Tax=Desulfobacter postgatei TaxID=2293 RepID=UPI002A36C05D|nr:type II toxin-antitoxin system prevent-host-death family antitoxin [Desulfobacter postgatei]MDX9963744.1 type II toxin-antitoxin system prevent-host-death family antitoxin [Desulfobacter postgatei]
MPQVNIHQAKAQFSKLIVSVENGEEIIIARYGKPVAKLVPISKDISPRRRAHSHFPGYAAGTGLCVFAICFRQFQRPAL